MDGVINYLFGNIIKRFSVSTHHYLNDFEEPRKESRSAAFLVRFTLITSDGGVNLVPEPRYRSPVDGTSCVFFRELASKMRDDQKAIITSIAVTFNSNDMDHRHVFRIMDMFEAQTTLHIEEEGHPDKTGTTSFVVPARMNKPVPRAERNIYEPNLINLGINVLQYAGMEAAILNQRSSVLPATAEDILGVPNGADAHSYEVFRAGDAIAVFIVQHRGILECTDLDVSERPGEDGGAAIYVISKRVLARVRDLFRVAIFPLLLYTRFDRAHMVWDPPSEEVGRALYEEHKEALEGGKAENAPTLMMLITVDYILVTPGVPMFKTKTLDLGI
jgi:hypothetical protein